MSEQQISKLVGSLVEHQHYFGAMSVEDRQWVIRNTKNAVALFAEAVKNRTIPTEKRLLERLTTTIAIPAMPQFIAVDNFIVDTSSSAKVKINYLSDNFKVNFLRMVENKKVIAEELAINKLLEYAYDSTIITALGGEAKVEITLGQFFAAFAKQPNGESGALLTNGYFNISYVRDITGVLWAVHGYWFDDGWRFRAVSVDNSSNWCEGNQFLSR